MEKFQPGTVVFHKATGHKCVVIKVSGELVKVRDQNNQEQDYYPQELETQEERNVKSKKQTEEQNAANEKRGKELSHGF